MHLLLIKENLKAAIAVLAFRRLGEKDFRIHAPNQRITVAGQEQESLADWRWSTQNHC